MMCVRQFVQGNGREVVNDRPRCPRCAKPMYQYKKEPGIIRFRCSCYPTCKSYAKILARPAGHDASEQEIPNVNKVGV